MQWEKIGNVFYKFFLKPLLLLFGMNDKYYDCLVREGAELKLSHVKKNIEKYKIEEQVTNLYLISFFEATEQNIDQQAVLIKQGSFKPFIQEGRFNPLVGYVEVYLIKTVSEKFYIGAFLDSSNLELPLSFLWFLPLPAEMMNKLSELENFQVSKGYILTS